MRQLGKVGVPVGGSHIILTAVLGRSGPSKFISLSTLYRDPEIGAILISWFVACLIRRHRHIELLRG